jgi:hypothetical protein
MRNAHGPTPAEELAGQLERPSANAIWSRALEVFGDEAKAQSWMDAPRDIFGGRSPQELATGDAAEERRVLEVRVSSVVIPEECNILLTPNHTGYRNILWSEPRPFQFDPRFLITEPQTL